MGEAFLHFSQEGFHLSVVHGDAHLQSVPRRRAGPQQLLGPPPDAS